MTVTIKMTGVTVDGQAVADKNVTVGATTNMLIGPFTAEHEAGVGHQRRPGPRRVLLVTSLTRAYISTPW
jgi:hypothetical protein